MICQSSMYQSVNQQPWTSRHINSGSSLINLQQRPKVTQSLRTRPGTHDLW